MSTQHYSFAVKAFVEMVKKFDTSEYEFAVRETKTGEVISDVATLRSEIGMIYLNDFAEPRRRCRNETAYQREKELHIHGSSREYVI